jgi:hypothetical protein
MPPFYMETIDSKIINDFLKGHTKVPLTDKPIFKLVWADEEYELREGTYAIRDPKTTAIIAYAKKVDRVRKYGYIQERWILEQWYPPEVCQAGELPDACHEGSYEPIFVFEDKFRRALPLNKLVVEIIVSRLGAPTRSEAAIRADLRAQLDARDAQIEKMDWDLLNDEGPLVSQFHDGTAILNPLGDNNGTGI